MQIRYPLTMCLLLLATLVFAQPANDDCENAIEITNIDSWCSTIGEYTNVNATPSGFGPASCFAGADDDVWFSFTPIATDVTITIIGNQGSGSTLNQPEVALYTGDCAGTINEEQCESDITNNVIELYKGGLSVGTTYYIRVQGRNGNQGTFQLCINNYNPPVNPGSDCFTAAVLCNTETFVVQSVVGAGSDPTEADDAECLNIFGTVESNSTWFTWTAANSGTLTFELSPLNPPDDLDFVVYEWPGGPLVCDGQVVLRCMASSCTGPTGLNDNSTDTSEPPNCDSATQDNFLAPLQMVEGTTYALMVNNFSATGNGFEVSFGGTGVFVGPETEIESDEPDGVICIGESIQFSDASSFDLGMVTGYEWDFGESATPSTATGQGPHNVSFNTPGTKAIILTISTDRGCIDTEIITIEVECCAGNFTVDADITDVLCADDSNGAIDLTVTNNFGPYSFTWDSGQDTEDISDLTAGDYTVTIVDEASCDTTLTYTVEVPSPIEISVDITMPTCDGGMDGAIFLDVTGGVAPYEYNWQNSGYGPDSDLLNLSQGDYMVMVRDQNGCEEELLIEVRELELELDPTVNAITQPSCTGFSDGMITVVVANGTPPYQYDWGDGNGFVDESSLSNVQAGVYTVVVLDANLCTGTFEFDMQDYPPLEVSFDQMNASCNGIDDGEVTAIPAGGNGGYTFNWSVGGTTATIVDLSPGDYTVTVTDANGCVVESIATITEPNPIEVALDTVTDVVCFGDPTGTISVIGNGGTPPFMYSVDGTTFQDSPTLTGLVGGVYTVTLMDAQGCTTSLEAEVGTPPEIMVDAGEDQTIDLGFSADLRGVTNAFPATFQWSPAEGLECLGCDDPTAIPNPMAAPFETTVYLLTVFDENGCAASDSLTITVNKNRPLYIPNAFSPNDDGVNDFFTIYGGPAVSSIASLRVFDRWGALIFEGLNLTISEETEGWDGIFNGKKLNTGVFTYFGEVEFIDGVTVLVEGDISIVR